MKYVCVISTEELIVTGLERPLCSYKFRKLLKSMLHEHEIIFTWSKDTEKKDMFKIILVEGSDLWTYSGADRWQHGSLQQWHTYTATTQHIWHLRWWIINLRLKLKFSKCFIMKYFEWSMKMFSWRFVSQPLMWRWHLTDASAKRSSMAEEDNKWWKPETN